jgi:hypothetical protein
VLNENPPPTAVVVVATTAFVDQFTRLTVIPDPSPDGGFRTVPETMYSLFENGKENPRDGW